MRLVRRDAQGGARLVEDEWADRRLLSVDELDAIDAKAGPVGVAVGGSTDAKRLAPHLAKLALVAIELPRFTDGRAYSLARLLRERYGFEGELRAVGHVLREQLFYLHRCGFDSFVIAEGKDPTDALSAFGELSVTYQPAADQPQPIWRRRG